MFKERLLILLGFSLFPNYLYAEDYDLKKILDLANEKNKTIKLARADLEMASALKLEALSDALPRLNLDAGYNRNFMENVFFLTVLNQDTGKEETIRFRTSFKNQYQINAVLSQTIYSFGKVGSAMKAAGYFKEFTENNYASRENSVFTQVKKGFYQALFLKKVWEVALQSETSAFENYQNTKLKYEAGAVSEFDLLQSEVRWQNAIPNTMQAQKNYKLAKNNLKILVELPIDGEMNLVANFSSYPQLPDSIELHQILQTRPDYNALLWEMKLREKNIDIQFAEYLPTLNGSLTYTFTGASETFIRENENDNLFLGLSLNIPIFAGGFTRSKVQQARVELKKANTRLNITLDNIRVEVENIYLRMKEALQRITATNKAAKTARRSYEIAETRTKNGIATQLELKDSRLFLDQAELNYYNAIYDYLISYFDWQMATGKVTSTGI